MTELNSLTRARLETVSTATVTTQLLARGLRNTFIRGVLPIRAGQRKLVGPAFTLRYIPAREDLDVLAVFADYDHPQRLSIEQAPPGSVLVMDCRGDAGAASAGHILATRLAVRGVAGLVTDGGMRDVEAITALQLPVFHAGAVPTTNLARHHAVDLQQPIGCGGVPVYPGDVIVGDQDGAIVVPAELVDDVAAGAVAQEHMEAFILSRVAGGAGLRGTYPPDEKTRAEYELWAADNPIPELVPDRD